MPLGYFFSFKVIIGDKSLTEYTKDGKVYIESDLFTDRSYTIKADAIRDGEGETQYWPVTPYEIVVQPQDNSPCQWYELYIDGQCIWNKPLPGGRNFTITGYTEDSVHRELLFSLPRFAEDEKDRAARTTKDKLGQITIRCIEAHHIGYFEREFSDRKKINVAANFSKTNFYSANKKDVGTGGGCTRTGKALFAFVDGDGPKTRKRLPRYRRGEVVEELTVDYRIRPVLVEMGILKDLKASTKDEPFSPRPRGCGDYIDFKDLKTEEEMETAAANAQPTIPRVALVCQTTEEVITVEDENGKKVQIIRRQKNAPNKRVITIDDELTVIEDLDDSIVCLGEDDCYIDDAPIEEFPLYNLDGTLNDSVGMH